MSTHMNFSFFAEDTLLKIRLAVIIYAVGVVTSPGKLIIFPLTVSLVRCVSALGGYILATILP